MNVKKLLVSFYCGKLNPIKRSLKLSLQIMNQMEYPEYLHYWLHCWFENFCNRVKEIKRAGFAAFVFLMVVYACSVPASYPVVEQGESRAVVVLAEEPSPVARYAAQELVRHVEKATGVSLPVATESEVRKETLTRIYIGMTHAAREKGLVVDELEPDVFILRTIDGDIYVLGKEEKGLDPLDENNPYSGTLFGVYELLERSLKVRWLWPGELGTYIPETSTVRVGELDEEIAPSFRFRRYRWRRVQRVLNDYSADDRRLAFSDEGLKNYGKDLNTYIRRHRMGYSEPKPPVGHYFRDWWERYGEEHPEWFMMQENGERGPEPDITELQYSRGVAMCVSNPNLHDYILEEVWDGGDIIRLGEVDRGVYCHCPDCKAWDPPQPEWAERRIISDRYARFWKNISERAREIHPDVTVTTFLYMHYFMAPLTDIELNTNIYGEYVPWGGGNTLWFPASEERIDRAKEQWHGWSKTGITMAYRPNHTLSGYAMPHINTWQGGEFFKFTYENGSIGFDFDSLIGQWGVKGLEHYMYFRLFSDPERSIEEIRKEYFSAFGPAADAVERYFDYWEENNHLLLDEGVWHNLRRRPYHVPGQYPENVFPPAEEILDEAMQRAHEHPRTEYAERIAFLKAGLEHAQHTVRFLRKLGPYGSSPERREDFEEARRALEDLIQFRRDHEHLYIADYVHLAQVENRDLDIDAFFDSVR